MRLLFSSFMVVMALITMIVWVGHSLKFIELLLGQGLGLYGYVKMTILLIIPVFYIIIPICGAISVIYTINHLLIDREMTVFKAMGLSKLQLLVPFAKFLSVLVMLTYIFSVYLLPKSYSSFKEMQEQIRNSLLSQVIEEGVFNSQSDNITIYVGGKSVDHMLHNIIIYDCRNSEKPSTIIAENGYLIFEGEKPNFMLRNGMHIQRESKTGKVSSVGFDYYNFLMTNDSDIQSIRVQDLNELYLHELVLKASLDNKEGKIFLVNLNQRIIWPLYCFILGLLAFGMMNYGQFQRRGYFKRLMYSAIVVGVTVLLVFATNNFAIKNIGNIAFMYALLLGSAYAGKRLVSEKI